LASSEEYLFIEERKWILEALRTKSMLRADREATYSTKGTQKGWMVDTRLLLVDPEAMLRIAKLFWRQMENSDDFQLACLEMTGIPHCGIVSIQPLTEALSSQIFPSSTPSAIHY
jgi:hypothetical protein